jgi:hypothetical protein
MEVTMRRANDETWVTFVRVRTKKVLSAKHLHRDALRRHCDDGER